MDFEIASMYTPVYGELLNWANSQVFARVLIRCQDARCRHSFRSFDRHRRPASTTGRSAFRRSVVAESVLVKHQLLILNRGRKRAPNLRSADRVIAGLCTLFMRPVRVLRSAIVLKPSTLLHLHHLLAKRKYQMLFSTKRGRQPGPKGPSQELVDAVVEMNGVIPVGAARELPSRLLWLSASKSTRILFAVSWAFITGRNRMREVPPGSHFSAT